MEDLPLNPEQQTALSQIIEHVECDTHKTFLMHGVTGSGKTEVYIRAIQKVVEFGRQAIVLVPEISLTPQTRQRFRARFDRVAVFTFAFVCGSTSVALAADRSGACAGRDRSSQRDLCTNA